MTTFTQERNTITIISYNHYQRNCFALLKRTQWHVYETKRIQQKGFLLIHMKNKLTIKGKLCQLMFENTTREREIHLWKHAYWRFTLKIKRHLSATSIQNLDCAISTKVQKFKFIIFDTVS